MAPLYMNQSSSLTGGETILWEQAPSLTPLSLCLANQHQKAKLGGQGQNAALEICGGSISFSACSLCSGCHRCLVLFQQHSLLSETTQIKKKDPLASSKTHTSSSDTAALQSFSILRFKLFQSAPSENHHLICFSQLATSRTCSLVRLGGGGRLFFKNLSYDTTLELWPPKKLTGWLHLTLLSPDGGWSQLAWVGM